MWIQCERNCDKKIAKNNEKYPVEKSKGSAIEKNLLKDFIYSFFQE